MNVLCPATAGRLRRKSFDINGDIIAQTRPDYRFASLLHEAHYQAGEAAHENDVICRFLITVAMNQVTPA